MTAVSLLTALLMLEVYKLTSNQAAIRRAKDRIKAHLYEMRLYKDNMRVTLAAQGAILKANLAYMGANLKPLAVMIVPLVLILAQLSLWFDRAPLRPGEEALVKAGLEASADPVTLDLALETPPGPRDHRPGCAHRRRARGRLAGQGPVAGHGAAPFADGRPDDREIRGRGRASADQGLGPGLARVVLEAGPLSGRSGRSRPERPSGRSRSSIPPRP